MSVPAARETFEWTETGVRLRALLAAGDLHPDDRGRTLIGDGVRLVPPAALPLRGRDAETYLTALQDGLGTQLMVLLQAGAAALGLWQDDELVRHKAFKKYVVRGKGRAQSTHLKTRGKSRYGSRLRLQNARALLTEVNDRCAEWLEEEGAPDLVLYGCPVRLWADLFEATPPPPFERDAAHKVGVHVHVPTFEELERVRRATLRGCVERDTA